MLGWRKPRNLLTPPPPGRTNESEVHRMRRAVTAWSFCTIVAITGTAAHAAQPRCASHTPERRALFGELHVHTGASMDANLFGTSTRPADAYRFARGEAVELPALGADVAARTMRIERPLDFAAVTDHASGFGGVKLCTDPGSDVYESDACKLYRKPIELTGEVNLRAVIRELTSRVGADLESEAVCGDDGSRCRDAMGTVWQEMQQAAAAWNDASDECAFTAFVAYEYTATPELTKIHRNVIFRNENVIDYPISYTEEPSAIRLWQRLQAECNEAGTGCEVLAIPHNSNLSNGHMFAIEYGEAQTKSEQAEIARLRGSLEPIVEMMQMKGDSECRNGMWQVLGGNDELCDFEKLRPPETPDCEDGTGKGALAGDGCVSRLDYARYALVEGLREEERIGVNPYKFGMIAATDGHDGLAGPTEEHRLDLRVGRANPQTGMNNGGLAAVWAEENSRDSIFEALRRRETFGTSGPRMQLRFFGGWGYDASICEAPDLPARGYAGGVPMGGDLPAVSQAAGSPRFVVSALRDPGTESHPGGQLQRAQIIKGWADDDGNFHQQVVDVAGGPNDASVAGSCQPSGGGHQSLCTVWTDPDFDPAQRAVYYARVVENPSCNTTGWLCAAEGDAAPAFCASPAVGKTTQERAWSSPIWYTPAAE
jgi:hypothetical protein